MSIVAVVAHTGKSIGGGLPELRRVLAREGISDPLWYEVSKSKQAPKQVRRALARGADVIFAWGGDGLAQQLHRHPRRRPMPPLRSFPPAPRTCWRRTSASPKRFRRPSRSDSPAYVGGSTSAP